MILDKIEKYNDSGSKKPGNFLRNKNPGHVLHIVVKTLKMIASIVIHISSYMDHIVKIVFFEWCNYIVTC